MNVTLNGQVAELPAGTTVAGLVEATVEGHRHVAVALNGAVAPRSTWDTATLAEGDTVEILAPVAGG